MPGIAGSAVFLSIMAGRTIAGMRALLGASAAIVRAMPNTPAAVRQGITVALSRPRRDRAQRRAVRRSAAGDRRGRLGRGRRRCSIRSPPFPAAGPAYVFLLAELMEQAAIEQGIPPDLARLLARQTVAGSGALLAASAEDAAALRVAVTSPGGTTQAALAVLMASDAWPATLRRAIAAATARSRELAG